MSDKDQDDTIAITKEDSNVVKEFLEHFGVATPAYIQEVLLELETCEKITMELQEKFKTAIARMFVENADQGVFNDELFQQVRDNSKKIWFDKQFEQDFESCEPESNES